MSYQILKYCLRSILALLLLVLVLAALYMSLGRHYVPLLGQHKDLVMERISYLSGLKIEAAEFEPSWHRYYPLITLGDLSIYAGPDEQEPALRIDRLKLGIDPLASLLNRTIKIQSLSMQGLIIQMQQSQSGDWRLHGFSGKSSSRIESVKRFVSNIHNIELDDASVLFSSWSGQRVEMQSVSLLLNKSDRFRRLSLQASGDQSGEQLDLIVEARGDIFDLNNLSARAYLKADQLMMAKYALLFDYRHLRVLNLNGEVWFTWNEKPNAGLDMQVSAEIPQLAFQVAEKDFVFSDMRTLARMRYRSEQEFSLEMADLAFQYTDQDFEYSQLLLSRSDRDENLSLSAQSLSVDGIMRLLEASRLLPTKTADLLTQLKLGGDIENLYASIPLSKDKLKDIAISARLINANINAYHAIPKVSGVNALVAVKGLSGSALIDGEDGLLAFPNVYKEPFVLNKVTGSLHWLIEPKEYVFYLDGRNIQAQTPFGLASAAFDLTAAVSPKASLPTDLSLQIGLREGDISLRQHLIPMVLSDPLENWLLSSLQQGLIHEGGFILRACLSPDCDETPAVQLDATVSEASLLYHQDWPPLEGLAGSVSLSNTALDVVLKEGRVYDSQIQSAQARLLKPAPDQIAIAVNAKLNAKGADAVRFLQQTPVRKQLGEFIDDWQGGGKLDASIDLTIPINYQADAKVNIEAELEDANLTLSALNLPFTQINGELEFNTETGLNARYLQGKLWDETFNARINSAGSRLELNGVGRISMPALNAWAKQPLLDFAKGSADVDVAIVVKPGDAAIYFRSLLAGIALNLPKPFTKPVDQQKELTLKIPLSEPSKSWQLSYAELLKAEFDFNGGELYRANIALGKSRLRRSYEHEIRINGSLSSLYFEQWLDALDFYEQAQVKYKGQKPNPLTINASNVSIDKVYAFDRVLEYMLASATQHKDHWLFEINHPDVDVDVNVFADGKPMSVDIENLQLENILSQSDAAESEKLEIPKSLPDMDVDIRSVLISDDDFGSWRFKLRPDAQCLHFNDLNASFRAMSILGDTDQEGGRLRWCDEGSQQASYFTGRIDVSNMADVLSAWGYEGFLSSKKARFPVDINWAGAPYEFDFVSLSGQVNIDMSNGEFVNSPSGATNALKVVGFVNISKLLKRLRLDFSDLSSSGLSYDKISGRIEAEQGIMNLRQPLRIKTTSSEMLLSGVVDSHQKSLDTEMVITLPIANNLPWLAALAGGLPAAAGVYVVSKLLKKQVDKFSSAVYSMTGDWDNPEMKFQRLFDTSSKSESSVETKSAPQSSIKSADVIAPKLDESAPAAANNTKLKRAMGVDVGADTNVRDDSAPSNSAPASQALMTDKPKAANAEQDGN